MHSRIGGTGIAALMGEDSFGKTPLDVYNRIMHGHGGPSSVYMRRGTAQEPRVRGLYVAKHAAVIEPHPGVVLWRECFAATVDDLVTREGKRVTDYKTSSASKDNLRKWANGMLASYEWQLRLYMAVFDRPEAELFVAFGKDHMDGRDRPEEERWVDIDGEVRAFEIVDTQLYPVTRDLDKERRMIEVGEAFWREWILAEKPPIELPAPDPGVRLADTALSAAEFAALEEEHGIEVVRA